MLYGLLSAAGTVISVIIAVVAVGIVVMALVLHFVRKKQGKTGCGCDCSGCAGCTACRPEKSEKKDEKWAPPKGKRPKKYVYTICDL